MPNPSDSSSEYSSDSEEEVLSDNIDIESNDGNHGNENNDNEELLKCNYEISWAYKYFGEIHRKCSNEGWIKVAYVKGTSEWGMQWLDQYVHL